MRRWLFVGCLLLAGCATAPPRPPSAHPEQDWRRQQQAVSALTHWQLVGRIALFTESQGWHATVDWRQRRDNYDIRLIGPLGQGALRLVGDPGHVTLYDSDGQSVMADDPDQLLYRETGWRVPVEALRYWVLGVPAPGPVASRKLDPYGHLTELQQAGWRIRFLDYSERDGLQLPGRVFATTTRRG